MLSGPYGRQWISPNASKAFSDRLIIADESCLRGDCNNAIALYKAESQSNYIAKRRLNTIKRQLKKCAAGIEDLNVLKIGFVDWYVNFERDMPGILDLFKNNLFKTKYSEPEHADIIVAGCYGTRILNDAELVKDKIVIFFSGENLSPSYNYHDLSVTTRHNSFGGKNVRLPQWIGDLMINKTHIHMRDKDAMSFHPRNDRDLQITAIYNNATAEREEIISILKKRFGSNNVHIFGSQRTGHVNKYEILSRSVINVCFENSIGDGYITEKLLHARVMGCKALYWGDPSYSQDFRKCSEIFNLHGSKSISKAIEWCSMHLNRDNILPFTPKLVSPDVFSKKPDTQEVKLKLQMWASLVMRWRY